MNLIRRMLSGYRGLFVGLLIAGLALVAYGGGTDKPLLTAIGGALLGNSIGSFVGLLSNQEHEEKLLEHNQEHEEKLLEHEARLTKLVGEGVKDSFVSDSDEAMLDYYRREWHLYHVTRMEEVVWRRTILDFTKSRTPGRLTSELYWPDKSGEPAFYTVEAGMRDTRFIVFLKTKTGAEPAVVFVFPFMGYAFFAPRYYGVVFLETWDGTPAISPAIICSEVIHDHEVVGTLPPELAQRLDRVWRDDVEELCHPNGFFPETPKAHS